MLVKNEQGFYSFIFKEIKSNQGIITFFIQKEQVH
jgi:hypothetical protein